MTRRTCTGTCTGREGFVLVTVLWMVLALASLAGIYALYLGNTATGAAARAEVFPATGLSHAAVELAAFRLTAVPRDARPATDAFSFPMGRAQVRVATRDETARIDLNAAPAELLAALFETLGAPADAAKGYAERVIGWRSAETSDAADAELELYRSAGLDYGPRGAPFVHPDELWRVVGLPPRLVAAALPHVTVYSGRAQIDPDIADPVVAAAATLARRIASGGIDTPPELPGDRADAVRVTADIALANGRRRTLDAVILLRPFADAPYRTLYWREAAAGSSRRW